MSRHVVRTVAIALAGMLVVGACSVRTAGSPKGDVELSVVFEDVGNLVVGHSVQISDVAVGTVTGVELDGYEAVVTLSLEDGTNVPVETEAVLGQTSLLGEPYVELRPPAAEQASGEMLASGAVIENSRKQADFEIVTERAVEFLGAITAEDLNTLVTTGVEGFGGRGDELNGLLADLSTVVVDFDEQKDRIVRTIDGFARMAADLADGEEQVVGLVDDLSEASATLARNRDRMINALGSIRDFAQVSNDQVLTPHAAELTRMIRELDPITATLARQRPTIEALLVSVNQFLIKIDANVSPQAGRTGAQAQYIWAKGVTTPSGNLGGDGGPPDPAAEAEGSELPVDLAGLPDSLRQLVDDLRSLLGVGPNVSVEELIEILRNNVPDLSGGNGGSGQGPGLPELPPGVDGIVGGGG